MDITTLHSPSSEDSLLGTLLSKPALYIQTIGKITPAHFHNELNRKIWVAMVDTYSKSEEFDIISIEQAIKDKDKNVDTTRLYGLVGGYHSSAGLDNYMDTLEDKYRRREMYEIALGITNTTVEVDIAVDQIVHDSLEKITNVITSDEDNTFANTIYEIEEKIDEFLESGDEFLGMSTGIHSLDKMLDGIQGGQFIGFAAYTSQGKTWDALNIAYNLIEQGKKVCFITLENSKAQVLTRLASIHTGISDIKIKKGRMTDLERLDVREYMMKVVASGSTVYTSNNWNDIKNAITKESVVNKPDMFILDYLQIITGDKEPVRLLEDISGYLQNTLISIGIPMLALSQISNATANGATKEEVLKFKGSGAVGASVSTAIFKKSLHDREEIELRRQEGVPLESWWIVEKNRDGDYTGRIKTYFHPWSHKLWGEKEFAEQYGIDRYLKQVEALPIVAGEPTLAEIFSETDV